MLAFSRKRADIIREKDHRVEGAELTRFTTLPGWKCFAFIPRRSVPPRFEPVDFRHDVDHRVK